MTPRPSLCSKDVQLATHSLMCSDAHTGLTQGKQADIQAPHALAQECTEVCRLLPFEKLPHGFESSPGLTRHDTMRWTDSTAVSTEPV